MHEILPKLFVGTLQDAQNQDLLLQNSISAILAIGCDAKFPNDVFDYLCYPKLLDMPHVNIIRILNPSFNFIQEKLSQNCSILVHCVYGSSRSVSVCIAYLMQMNQWSFERAYAYIASRYDNMQVNQGFIAQLQLFERLKYNTIDATPFHALYHLFQFAVWLNKGMPCKYAMKRVFDTTDIYASSVTQPLVKEHNKTIVYRCKRCRTTIAYGHNVIPHLSFDKINYSKEERCTNSKTKSISNVLDFILQPQQSCFTNVALDSAETNPSLCTDHIFIEPLEWIYNQMDETTSIYDTVKLQCPKTSCASKLGLCKLNQTCNGCEMRVSPCIELHKSKLDCFWK